MSQTHDVTVATFTVLLAVRDAERARRIAAILRDDGHTVILAFDATSAANLTWQHRPEAIVFDPSLTGADGTELARRLRRSGLGEGAVILALGAIGAQAGPEGDVDYQLPISLDPVQLSGLIHYVRSMRNPR